MKKLLLAASIVLTSSVFATTEVTSGNSLPDLVEKCRRAMNNGQSGTAKVRVSCTKKDVSWEKKGEVVFTRLNDVTEITKKISSSKGNVGEATELSEDTPGVRVKCPVFKKVKKVAKVGAVLKCEDLVNGTDLTNFCTETFEDMSADELGNRTRTSTVEEYNPCADDLK